MPEQEVITQDVIPDSNLVDDINDEESNINGGGFINEDQDTVNETEMQALFDSLGLSEADAGEIDDRATIRMQEVLGTKPDGIWGRKSRDALTMFLKEQGIPDEIVEGVGNLPIKGNTNTALQEVIKEAPAFLEESGIQTPQDAIDALSRSLGSDYLQEPSEELSTNKDIFETLGQRESSGDYGAVNQLGYLGKYQFGGVALQDLGYQDNSGEWLGKDGITSKEDFLSSEEVQEKAIQDYFKIQEGYLESKGALRFVGREFAGEIVTKEGLLMAAHLVGAGAVSQMLKSGEVPEDANGVKATEYLKLGNELTKE